MELADRVTVLKDGKLVGTLERGELDKERMVSMMVGRVIEDIYPDRSQAQFGPELLRGGGADPPGKAGAREFFRSGRRDCGVGRLGGTGPADGDQSYFW